MNANSQWTRRDFFRIGGTLALSVASGGIGVVHAATPPTSAKSTHMVRTADEALEKLMNGNKRYVADQQPVHPRRSGDRRRMVAPQQKPFAAILGCADSRVPPEILFDQGVGDLFVIRVAGHVIDFSNLGQHRICRRWATSPSCASSGT